MKFVCFVIEDAAEMAARSVAYEAALSQEHIDYDKALRAGGHFVEAQALQAPAASKVVRRRDGRMLVSDGPFMETKEHVGGFILIEAPDLDKAIELAAGIPSARFSAIEVRPIRNLEAEIAAAKAG